MLLTPLQPLDDALACAPWFRGTDTVLAAVSGGPDSMALLAGLARLARERSFVLVAAHFDHQLRDTSAEDAAHVVKHATALGIRVVTGTGDVHARARNGRESIEAAARALRYDFLIATANDVNARWIATGHTRDDQAETVLLRMRRGAGTRGLVGIHEQRGNIVRPLLDVARADTLHYCAMHAIPFLKDPGNDDRRFERNTVRHDILPGMRAKQPDIDELLIEIAASSRRKLEALRRDTDARRRVGFVRENKSTWHLDAVALEGLEPDATALLFADALASIDADRDVSRTHYERLAALRVGQSIDIPGMHVRRDHDAWVFSTRDQQAARVLSSRHPARSAARGPRLDATRACGWFVDTTESLGDAARTALLATPQPRTSMTQWIAADPADTLIARHPKPGDVIQPFGMTGHKKLSDVFMDARIPHRKRASRLVVERNEEIVWVPGIITAESARITENTHHAVCMTAHENV